MTLLALSTSTRRGSVAVLESVPVAIHEASYEDLRGQAERLFGAIDQALAHAGVDRSAITALACDVGPGSFTGVRVGVASAKGIAMVLRVPLIGVVSLEAMAAAAFADGRVAPDDLVAPLIDAKKDEVFAAIYDRTLGAVLAPCHLPLAVCAEACAGASSGRVSSTVRLVYVGEIASQIPDTAGTLLRGASLDLPSAAWIAKVGRARLDGGVPAEPGALEALYVRAPDAKRSAGPPGLD